MNYDELMLFVVKQQKLTGNVVTCYEAGAFGFHLHHRSEELGIKNHVMQPRAWDERGKGVKNDRLDAAALCQRLDRYERGNKKAFSTVRIPTVDEQRERAMSRQQEFSFSAGSRETVGERIRAREERRSAAPTRSFPSKRFARPHWALGVRIQRIPVIRGNPSHGFLHPLSPLLLKSRPIVLLPRIRRQVIQLGPLGLPN
jgi:transposase